MKVPTYMRFGSYTQLGGNEYAIYTKEHDNHLPPIIMNVTENTELTTKLHSRFPFLDLQKCDVFTDSVDQNGKCGIDILKDMIIQDNQYKALYIKDAAAISRDTFEFVSFLKELKDSRSDLKVYCASVDGQAEEIEFALADMIADRISETETLEEEETFELNM